MTKKIIITMLLIAVFSIAVFAGENNYSEAYVNASKLLASNTKVNTAGPFPQLSSFAEHLTAEEKMDLYVRYKQKPALYAILNGIGFGLGSWVQGDTVGGIIGTVLDTAGLTMVIVGAKNLKDAYLDMKREDIGVTEKTIDKYLNNVGLFSLGVIAMSASRAITITKSIKRVDQYNDFLATALKMVQTVQFVPVVAENGNLAAAVTGKISF